MSRSLDHSPAVSRRLHRLVTLTSMAMVCLACAEPPPPPASPAPLPQGPLAIGESADVQLYAMRLDVTGFEQEVSLQDLQALPASVADSMWLYDMDLNGHDGSPRLLDNALAQIRAKDPWSPEVGAAERNMIRALNMTPGNASLAGTRIEKLLELGPKIGIPSPQVLADALGIAVDSPFLDEKWLAEAVLANVISTHPNAQFRNGRKTDTHPDGKYPVPFGHLPVTLGDVASKLTKLSARFGPVSGGGQHHPGFVVGSTEADVLGPDFKMIIKANANALPFKGARLATATIGSVPSIGNDGADLFDFNDPDWMRIVGLTDKPVVTKMTFQLIEHPKYLAAGDSPLPKPWGNSPVWSAPKWAIERVVARAAWLQYKSRSYSKDYFLGSNPKPMLSLTIENGWMHISTQADIGEPPPPMYIWDMISEVAQFRLHDGGDAANPVVYGIDEGDANVRFALSDIAVGVSAEQITQMVRANLEADPSQLVTTAAYILKQAQGRPDFFYYRPRHDSGDSGSDWLYFVAADDIEQLDGAPARSYPTVGFFADAQLTQKLSTKALVDGDEEHEKVQIQPGDTLFCADDAGSRFQLTVLPKPSRARVRLRITRVK